MTSMKTPPDPRLDRKAHRRRREGAAAVEFGLVALPFFLLLFSIFELGLVFITDAVAENAVITVSRDIRTGQAQAKAVDAAAFKKAFCDQMSVFEADCPARATIDVRVVDKFSDPIDMPTDANGVLDLSKVVYDPGGAQSLVVVRVWYKHPMIVPALTQAVTSAGPGSIMISAAAAFRNEPFA